MKTAQHLDLARSQTLASEIAPVAAKCYWNAHRAALAIGANATYCEGWIMFPLSLASPDQQGYTIVGHGWAEKDGRVIDTEGAGALAYFASTRRTVGQVQPEDLPLHVTDKQADRRHQRAMQRAMSHMLTLSPTWASAILIQNPPIV